MSVATITNISLELGLTAEKCKHCRYAQKPTPKLKRNLSTDVTMDMAHFAVDLGFFYVCRSTVK